MTWEWLRDYVTTVVARAVRFTQVASTSANGYTDAVDGHAGGGTDPNYRLSVRRLFPFGLRSRPPAGVDCVVVHANGGITNGIMVGAESTRYGPSNLNVGEVAIYSIAAAAMIKIDKTGVITILSSDTKNIAIAATGTGEVVVNSGTLEVARDTDPVNAGTLTGQAGPYPVVFTHVDAKTSAVTIGQSVQLTGKITDGAARFKG